MLKITAILWQSHATTMRRAGELLKEWCSLRVYSARYLDEGKEDMASALDDLDNSDLIFFYRSSGEAIWDELENAVKQLDKKVVCLGHDPGLWLLSTVPLEVVDKCHTYIVYGGVDNFSQMLSYLAAEVLGLQVAYKEPFAHHWEGIYHPNASRYFDKIEDYLTWYQPRNVPTIGILFSRGYWVNDNIAVEALLIKLFEAKGYNVIPAFCYSVKDADLGTRGSAGVVQDFFFDREGKPRINAMVKLISFFLESKKGEDFHKEDVAVSGVNLLKRLNVPIFQPVVSYHRTIEEWIADPQGLSNEISWTISMPEFEGVIEPLYIGGVGRDGDMEFRDPQPERCQHLVDRVSNWIRLAEKPITERKVAFILHNNPCASVEVTVGGGAKLDTLESVARILQQMQKEGYAVDIPADGKELIDNIMNHKAISEFRWTTTDEIVSKGGALKLVPVEEYCQWFDTLSSHIRKRISNAWGVPPGEELNGVPAAMVYDGKILVTGVQYGNAVICVQPKRGCAGPKCDGQVCKILHDPDIPPPHQYMATYRFIEHDFKADVIIHVGTHGNLEFLPGKGAGLSRDCYPDLGIGDLPHLYIYNADNPPEGVIAKRRSYAALIDHMQTVMTEGGLYDELAELDRYLEEYEKAKIADPTRAHMLEHMIIEEIKKANLDKQIPADGGHDNIEEIIEGAHGILSTIRNTQIQDGMHIFGELPEGERKVSFINSILRFDAGQDVSLRRSIAALMDLDLVELIADQSKISLKHSKSYGALLEEIDIAGKAFIQHFLTRSTAGI
jgi:cobaltochelatase CobN